MATCPQCQHYISPMEIMTKPLYCPKCDTKLGFIRKEYRRVTRPGFFIAVLLLTNVRYTIDPMMRAGFNVGILALWFYFFYRYVQYLKTAQFEKR